MKWPLAAMTLYDKESNGLASDAKVIERFRKDARKEGMPL